MTQMIIRKTKIDWKGLIDLALNRQDWGKSYALFTTGKVTISVEMTSFNFKGNYANFEIKCVYPEDELTDRWALDRTVQYYLNNYSVKEFETLMMKSVRTLLNDIVLSRTKTKARKIYKDLEVNCYMIDTPEFLRKIHALREYQKIQKIVDENIRKRCIGEFIWALKDIHNKKFIDSIENYAKTNRETLPEFESIIKEISTSLDKN